MVVQLWSGRMLFSFPQTIAYAFKELLFGLRDWFLGESVRFWSELVLAKRNLLLVLRVNDV